MNKTLEDLNEKIAARTFVDNSIPMSSKMYLVLTSSHRIDGEALHQSDDYARAVCERVASCLKRAWQVDTTWLMNGDYSSRRTIASVAREYDALLKG